MTWSPAPRRSLAAVSAAIDYAVCVPVLTVIGSREGGTGDHLRRAVTAALAARGVPIATIPPDRAPSDVVELWPTVKLAI